MVNYLAPIDLEDETLSAGVIEKTVQMATGVPGAKIYLMTVIPGISPGIDQRYAIRGEMMARPNTRCSSGKMRRRRNCRTSPIKAYPRRCRAGLWLKMVRFIAKL